MLTAPSWKYGVTHPRNGNERTVSRPFVHQAYPPAASWCVLEATGRAAHGEQITPEISSPRVARPVSTCLDRSRPIYVTAKIAALGRESYAISRGGDAGIVHNPPQLASNHHDSSDFSARRYSRGDTP